MKRIALMSAFLVCVLPCQAQSFLGEHLSEDNASLTLQKTDHTQSAAPKFADQNAFDKPAVSGDGEYVGWVALYPNQGASYVLPLELVVLDGANRIHRFAGDFGMVFGWCFAPDSQAVVLRYSFPHGATPVGFDMRRIEDGKLLRRYTMQLGSDGDEDALFKKKTPAWARCASASRAKE